MTSPHRQTLIGGYQFELDTFQLQAFDHIDAGESVLVAAPTGSGKTVVAEYAIGLARKLGKRAFYTAPIKALSNQKFHELTLLHGPQQVGLMTGDNSINPQAPIIVMTTEVLRNMIYARSSGIDNLGVVVLDEVHFLQDAYRGPVWEEVIIHLEPTVQLVCLSATVSNADELCEWLTTVRGPTIPIVETKRPVELFNHYVVGDKTTSKVRVFDTLVGGKPNEQVSKIENSSAPRSKKQHSYGSRGRIGMATTRFYAPNRSDVVLQLREDDLLPAIYFIFSRNQCDEAAHSCLKQGISFTTKQERAAIAEILDSHVEAFTDDDLAALQYSRFLAQLEAGIGVHHAGLVPSFKEAVEECFAKGLVKIVFATETLAVGINMPARAVVLDKLTKYNGETHQLLKPSDFSQLTGRAGRRGLDTVGHALTLWNPFVTFEQVAALVSSRSFVLNSAFRPTYNMAANLIRTTSKVQARHLLNLSFAQFQSGKDIVEIQARIQRRSKELVRLQDQAFSAYGDIEEYRAGSTARKPLQNSEDVFSSLRPGDVVLIGETLPNERLVVISSANRGSGGKLSLLTISKGVKTITARDITEHVYTIGHIALPTPYQPTNSRFLKETSAKLSRFKINERMLVRSGRNRKVRNDHPFLNDPDAKFKLNAAESADRIAKELAQLEKRVSTSVQSVSKKFEDLTNLLEQWGYVDDWKLTKKGVRLGRIFHESDLLIAECLSEGVFDDLDHYELASLTSVFVYEDRKREALERIHFPNSKLDDRWAKIEQISRKLSAQEVQYGLLPHRFPDPGFMCTAYDWAHGTSLFDILDEDDVTAGDFVRTMKQLIDLLRQFSTIDDETVSSTISGLAAKSLFTGVVAASSQIGKM
ncbi:MAG: DEAD/DEAH box helicase [Ilumatobacteraceae bacterium]